MNGETDLDTILASLDPQASTDEFVFCTFPEGRYSDHAILDPIACVTEDEGLTLVLPREQADVSSLPYETAFRRITLSVHSSLTAVGLTAAVATRLAEHGISANVVAGYYHDHIFVPSELANEAVATLSARFH
ncbi:MAG TPA: ACT domain-containing protein [Alkalispirochaeta sp.]|nr:ACT domain-containing protein [Alkalispirochaeta sp.]